MSDVRLHDIKTHFPVPGDYHFRFQFKYQGTLVWLDLSNDDCALPQVDGMIVMKVTRKSWNTMRTQPVTNNKTKQTVKDNHHSEGSKLVDDLLGSGWDPSPLQ